MRERGESVPITHLAGHWDCPCGKTLHTLSQWGGAGRWWHSGTRLDIQGRQYLDLFPGMPRPAGPSHACHPECAVLGESVSHSLPFTRESISCFQPHGPSGEKEIIVKCVSTHEASLLKTSQGLICLQKKAFVALHVPPPFHLVSLTTWTPALPPGLLPKQNQPLHLFLLAPLCCPTPSISTARSPEHPHCSMELSVGVSAGLLAGVFLVLLGMPNP